MRTYRCVRDILDPKFPFAPRVKDKLANVVKHANAITAETCAALVRIVTSNHKDESAKSCGEWSSQQQPKTGSVPLGRPPADVRRASRARRTLQRDDRAVFLPEEHPGAQAPAIELSEGCEMSLSPALNLSPPIVPWTGLKVRERPWEMVPQYLLG